MSLCNISQQPLPSLLLNPLNNGHVVTTVTVKVYFLGLRLVAELTQFLQNMAVLRLVNTSLINHRLSRSCGAALAPRIKVTANIDVQTAVCIVARAQVRVDRLLEEDARRNLLLGHVKPEVPR